MKSSMKLFNASVQIIPHKEISAHYKLECKTVQHKDVLDARVAPINPHVISPFISSLSPSSIVIHLIPMYMTWVVIRNPRELCRNYLINPMPKYPIMQYAGSKY
jgi:hypothetical protein